MTRLVAFFVDRPLVVKLVIFAVAIVGGMSIINMQKEGFPNIVIKKVFITTIYPGASALDVEMNVTVPIEEELAEVTGIQELSSNSQDGISSIIAEIDENASKSRLKEIYDDIDSTVSQVENLPDDIDGKPTLKLITSEDLSIIEIALSGDIKELKSYARLLKSRVKDISRVTQVSSIGLPDDEVQILVDPKKARQYQIGLRAIANSIKARNLEGSGGTLESFLSEKKIVSVNKYKKPEDVLKTYLRVSDIGYAVQLKSLASVKVVPEETHLRVRNNGKPGISLLITKRGNADIIDTIDEIKEVVKKQKKPAGIGLVYLNDQSQITRSRLSIVTGNAVVGFILVLIILFLVFDWNIAIWTAFGIPFSFLGAFILLSFTDVTLNMLTLGGFIIVLGMLVDDAIVVADNIQSYRENGMPAREACIQAVKDIWLPILAASLTTIMAFTPMLSFGGLPGQFIYIIPLIVILALSVSLFDSYFILPSHLLHSKSSKPKKKKAFIVWLENTYENFLKPVLKFRYAVFLVFISLLIFSIFILKNYVDKESFPQESAEGFNIQYRLVKGASFEKTKQVVTVIEKYLSKLKKNELIGFSSRLGTQSLATDTERGSQHNIGITFVYLTPYSQREFTARAMMAELRLKFNKDKILRKEVAITLELTRVGPPLGKPFEIRVTTNNDQVREARVEEIKKFITQIDGVFEVADDDIDGKDELNIELNHKTLQLAGLTISDVLQTLRTAYDGQIVTNMITLEGTLNFRLRMTEKARADIQYLRKLPIQNKVGSLIDLGPFISAKERSSKSSITHINGKRTVTIFGNLEANKISGGDLVKQVKLKFQNDPEIRLSFSGQPVEQGKIFGGIGSAALIAVIAVYIIISLVFDSFIQPLVIILVIPFGLIGIVFAAVTHGAPMSMFAGIALVGLTGVVVNDSIVMVHTIKEKMGSAMLDHKILIEGAVGRLRPILLTTITTVLGVFPSAYGIGGMDPFVAQMCLFLGYGLLFSTLVVLFLIPALFSIIEDLKQIPIKFHSKKN